MKVNNVSASLWRGAAGQGSSPPAAKQQELSSSWWPKLLGLDPPTWPCCLLPLDPIWVTPTAAAGTNKAPVAAAQNWPGTEPFVP